MLPILKKMREKKEIKPSGVTVQERANEYSEPDSSVEAIEPYAVAILMAIAAKDPKALAEAIIDAHDEMHAQWDQEDSSISPHTYEHQNKLAGE